MSQGRPTKLVRDGGVEAYDPPPDLPLPTELVPCVSDSGEDSGAGEGGQEPGYSDRRARRAAFDAITGVSLVDEPDGNW
jgi:hypothetical protein